MQYLNKRKRKKKVLAMLILLLIVLLTVFIVFEIRITPVITAMAESRARNIATETVNDAVQKVLCNKDLRYENLVTLTHDEAGLITSVTVDSVKTNQLCAEIRGAVIDTLAGLGEKTVEIPIGTLTGIDILTGRGPRLTVAIALSGSATTSINNEFHTAGINQTRHQMILSVKTKIYIIMQNGNLSTEIENSIVVAETVIVGEVPEIYSDGSSELWENLVGYE